MKQTQTPTDKTYKLLKGSPLSYTLPTRNNQYMSLLWYDEKNNINRALRYASNQKSPFEDEQDGNAIVPPVVFEDGLLFVPKTNPVLQLFLHYHPENNLTYAEVNKEKDAFKQVEDLNLEVDALIEAKSLQVEQLEMVFRVIFGRDPSSISTAELKRDILIFAKQQPREFLQVINDPELKFQSKVRLFFEHNFLTLRNNNKEIWFNTLGNKKKMMSVPYGEEPYEAAGYYLKSDDGLEALKALEAMLEK
jgi:hypothetical protein